MVHNIYCVLLSHLTHINIAIELPSVIKFLLLIKGATGSIEAAVEGVGRVGGREHIGFHSAFCFQAWDWIGFFSLSRFGQSLFDFNSKNYVLTWQATFCLSTA